LLVILTQTQQNSVVCSRFWIFYHRGWRHEGDVNTKLER
jgi:hypothetical protein